MKTTNSETQVLKGSIAFLLLTAILMSVILFTSCSNNSEEIIQDDENLITAIETSTNRQAVEVNELPTAIQNELETNFSKDEIYVADKVAGLGFEIKLVTTEGSWTSELNSAFFTEAGRFVQDARRPRRGRRRSCFHIVFPFSLTMPDATIITLESRADKVLVRQWYVANPDVQEKPNLVFPIEIEYQDGTIATINDSVELEAARLDCRTTRCFDYVYPFTVTMPDGSTITLSSDDDRSLIRAWYVANPGVHERPTLVFPLEIIYQDGTIETINNETELEDARNNC